MADNTDTELLDWLNKQERVGIHLQPRIGKGGKREWFVQVNGEVAFDKDIRTACQALKGETKTATKGE